MKDVPMSEEVLDVIIECVGDIEKGSTNYDDLANDPIIVHNLGLSANATPEDIRQWIEKGVAYICDHGYEDLELAPGSTRQQILDALADQEKFIEAVVKHEATKRAALTYRFFELHDLPVSDDLLSLLCADLELEPNTSRDKVAIAVDSTLDVVAQFGDHTCLEHELSPMSTRDQLDNAIKDDPWLGRYLTCKDPAKEYAPEDDEEDYE